MLIEVKAKVLRPTEKKSKWCNETYIVDKEFFSEAEFLITRDLEVEQNSNLVEDFIIQAIKISGIKEIATQYEGELSFVATLKDTWLDDDGSEKQLKYKVLLWANDLTEANQRVQELSTEGYDMVVEGIKQVNYFYIIDTTNSEENDNREQD